MNSYSIVVLSDPASLVKSKTGFFRHKKSPSTTRAVNGHNHMHKDNIFYMNRILIMNLFH